MKKSGLDVIESKEGQRVLDIANGRGTRLSAKQKRALETVTIADESTNNATAISSADGAKVAIIGEIWKSRAKLLRNRLFKKIASATE